MNKFKELQKKEIFKSNVFRVTERKYLDFDGNQFKRQIIERDDSVGIVATFLDTDQAVFVLEWCAGINNWVLSIPGGKTKETNNKMKIKEALRELHEETGYKAKNVKVLHQFNSMPGYMKRNVTLFTGNISEEGLQELGKHEYIKIKILSINEVITQVNQKKFEFEVDPEGLLALLLWKSMKQ